MSESLPNNTYAPIIHNGLGIITGNAVAHSLQRNNYSLSATSINNKARDSIFSKSGSYQINQSTAGDIVTQADVGNITIQAGANNASAIYFYASNTTEGGITMESGNGGIIMDTSGNITINSTGNGDIFLGGPNTGNITLQANLKVDILADDFNVTVDNNINLISEFGEIILSSNSGEPNQRVTLDNGGNLVIGTNEGVLFGYKTELAVTSEANTAPGRNGMAIYSKDADISPEMRINYTNPDGAREVTTVLGAYSANSDEAVYQKYTAYQHGQLMIRISGPEFTYNDIGRRLIFETSGDTCNITSIGTVILPPIATYTSAVTLTVGGVYVGARDATIIVKIDSEEDTLVGRDSDTFRWSIDGGATWQQTFVPVIYAHDIRYQLVADGIATGVYVSFNSETLGTLGDNWTIYAKITAIVDTNLYPYTYTDTVDESSGDIFVGIDTITNAPITTTGTAGSPVKATLGSDLLIQSAETLVAMSPYTGFVGTDTNNDFIIKTGGTERMRVTADGSLCVGQEGSDARLQLTSNFNKPMLVNDNLINLTTISNSSGVYGYQQNPASTPINTGGYVIVYESQDPLTGFFRVYGNYFTANGDKLGDSFQISDTPPTTYNQFQPHTCQAYDKQSDEYLVVWASQDGNSADQYTIKFRAYNNGNQLIGSESALDKPSGMTVCLNPRVASYAGGYIIVFNAAATNDPSAIYTMYYTRVYKSGSTFTQDNPVQIATSDVGKNHVYPYVCGLSPVDIAAPGGVVITYLAQIYGNDPRYQIRYRVYDSDLVEASVESNVTNTGVFDSQSDQDLFLSDGLPSCAAVPDTLAKIIGGFTIAFNTNYTAAYDYASITPPGTISITGLSSSAFGRIQNATVASNIITLNVSNVYLDFIQGEKLQVVSPDGYVIEKAALVTTTVANTQVEHWANITLSTDPKEIRLKYYGTGPLVGNPSASGDIRFDSTVNTGDLVIDIERSVLPTAAINISPINFTRAAQPNFYAYRPLTHVATNDNNECIVAWESGSTPHVYSQRVSLQLDELAAPRFIGTERLYAQNALGQRQTDPFVSPLVNTQGGVLGYSIAFGQFAVDLSYTAVQQELIGANSYLLHINNQTAEFVVTHDGQLGLNNTEPSATLHVAALPSANPTDPQTASIILQTPSTNIDTINDKHQIRFADGNGTELARIKVKYSDYYQDLNPQADQLISYFKFDELPGALAAVNSSAYNIQSNIFTDLGNVNTGLINNHSQSGTLIGFDTEKCWTTGKINNGLSFNGFAASNYVKIQRSGDVTAPFPETIPSMGDGSFAVSTWLKTVGTSFTGLKMGIVSIGTAPVGGLDSDSGAFQLLLRNDVATGGSNLFPVLHMSNGSVVTDIYSGANTVGDQAWHHVVWDYYDSATSNMANIWIDGVLVQSQSISPGIDTAVADTNASFKNVYIGANVGGNGLYYNGVLDELRFYKTHLSNSDISRLYTYGSEQRASLLIQTLGTNSTFSDTGPGLVLDDTGSLLGAQFRNNTSRILSGALYFQNAGESVVYGLDTQFLGEINQGDNILLANEITNPIDIGNNLYQVVSISSDTLLTIDRVPDILVVSSSNTTFDNVTIYPGIISAKDENSDLKMTMNHFGDLIVGNRRSTTNPTRLEIRGSGDAEDKNGLTLHNTNTSVVDVSVDTTGTRANKIYFKTANTSSQADVLQGMVKTSLSNAGAYASQIEFFVNNDTTTDVTDESNLTKQLTLANNSVLIGEASLASNIIPGQLTVQSFDADPLTLTFVNRQPTIGSVFDSSIDTLYYSEALATNQNNPLIRVLVSHDYPNATTASKNCGRMDFYVGNEFNSLETAFIDGENIADPQSLSRFCITANGFVGVHSQRPTGVFQVSPRYVDNNNKIFTANITASTTGNITVDDDITGTLNNYLMRGGSMVVYDGANLVAYPLSNIADPIITGGSVPIGSSNIQLLDLAAPPVGQDYTDRPYSLHYPGMLVNKYGLVGIGNTAFGDANQDYHLDVSGNTVVKGVLSFGANISSAVVPSTALGFKASADGSNLEVRTTVSGAFTPIGDLISATSGFRINPTTSNIDLKDITTGGVYFGLQNYVSRRAIKEITTNPYAVDLSTDYTILSNIPGAGPNDINLPTTFTSEYEGKIIVIKNINANPVNVNGWIDSTSGNIIALIQNQSITLQAATISSQNQYFIIG